MGDFDYRQCNPSEDNFYPRVVGAVAAILDGVVDAKSHQDWRAARSDENDMRPVSGYLELVLNTGSAIGVAPHRRLFMMRRRRNEGSVDLRVEKMRSAYEEGGSDRSLSRYWRGRLRSGYAQRNAFFATVCDGRYCRRCKD